MKILAFSDLHRDLGQAAQLVDRSADADVVIAAGDFASVHEGLEEAIDALRPISVPTVLGALLVLSLLGGGGPVIIALVIVMFGWPDMTRLVRSTVISGKQRGYVRAARTMGSRGRRILRRHVLPNGIAPVLVFAAYVVGFSVGAEAGLTYLGVGLRLPAISWGLQLAVADTRFPEDAYLMFWPSLFLCLLIGAFILLGESLRDAMDPKLFGGDG